VACLCSQPHRRFRVSSLVHGMQLDTYNTHSWLKRTSCGL
jgi:hypothetical protein